MSTPEIDSAVKSAAVKPQLDTGGLFARQATGLVREVSGTQQILLSYLSGMPPIALAFAVFFALSGFPGGNLIVAGLLALPLALSFAYTYGLLTSAMPRTGGDYVFNSRILHPLTGLISSCSFGLALIMTIASFACIGFTTLGLAPSFSTIGVLTESSTLIHWSETLEASKAWQFGISVPLIIIGSGVCMFGWRFTRRVLFGILWLSMAGLAVTLLIALFTSQSGFASAFDSFGAKHGVENAYQSVINGAQEAGIPIGAGFSWSKTIPMVGAVATVGLYAWFSSFMGGEIRQGSSLKVAHRNGIAAFLIIGGLVVCVAIFFKAFGQDFLTAVYGNGLPEGLGTVPTYVYLTSAQVGSPVLAILLSIAFIGIFFMLIPYQVLGVTRYIFAWAFDGLLPHGATRLNKWGAPDVAVAVAAILSLLVVYWSIYIASNLVEVVVYITLFNFISMGITAISAIVFPYRMRAQYQASSSNVTVFGVPLMVWSGLVSLGCIAFVTYLYFHYEFFGLSDKAGLIPWIVGIVAVAAGLYYIPRAIRRREGIDLSLAYSEIPPE